MNCSDRCLGQFGFDAAVEQHDAAEGRLRVAGERALVGLERGRSDRYPAWVVVLDDHARRDLELGQQQATGVEIEQVVERDRLAAELGDHREHVGPRADLLVVGGALVGVLTVGQLEHLLEGAHEQRREVLALLLEPARDRGVVARRVGERLGGKALAGPERQATVGFAQLVEHRVVADRIDHRRRVRVVLGGGADHRRTADVDVLDRPPRRRRPAAPRCARTGTGSRTRGPRTAPRAPRRRAYAPCCRAPREGLRTASDATS